MSNRNRERDYTSKFLKRLKGEGARVKRYRDLGWRNPYDGFVYYEKFMPFEAKFLDGRKTYNLDNWKRDQPHQFSNLSYDYNVKASPFFLIFWKVKGRVRTIAAPFQDIIEPSKLVLSELKEVNCLKDLMEL